ncbi:hypothetical protein MNB_SV-12-239 [hydrothermal vent metagenome]|uniref:DUF3570 domain-containing protein n=1 Tax=hydrothermal vent metagenome TaxID=652676 RepID=A0A1W1CIX1_9ZZZZ
MDRYRDELSTWLVDSSNSIDNYFIEANGTATSTTYAELKTSFALESGRSSEYAIRLRLRLNLPKVQEKLRVVFEDSDSDDDFYDSTKLDNDRYLDKKDYYLRLEYFNYIINKLSFSLSGGVKLNRLDIYPYVNLKVKYNVDSSDNNKRVVSNRFRYYINEDIEDIISYNILYPLEESFYCTVRNSVRYRNWQDYQQIVNSISFVKSIEKNRYLSVGASLLNELEDIDLTLQYPKIYSTYRGKLYKEWIYYELTPSILWRKENDYHESYRFMVSIGMIFKKD